MLNQDVRYVITLLQQTVSPATQGTISVDFHVLRALKQDVLTATQHRVSLVSQATTFQEDHAPCALHPCLDAASAHHLLCVLNVNPFFT